MKAILLLRLQIRTLSYRQNHMPVQDIHHCLIYAYGAGSAGEASRPPPPVSFIVPRMPYSPQSLHLPHPIAKRQV